MYILDIIPLQKGIPRDTLSYFSMREIPLGSLVEIPLRNQTIQGIVIKQNEARDMKASIRSGNFSLKPVGSIVNEKGFPSKILQTLQILSLQTLIPLGTLLVNFFPEPVFEYFQNWKQLSKSKSEIRLIALRNIERFEYYKVLIRESFTKKQSIHFVCSTVSEITVLSKFFEETIPKQQIVVLHGSQTDTAREKAYEQIKTTISEPIIVCTTPQFFMIPRSDITSCIIESFGSPHYIQNFTNNIDYRTIIFALSEMLGYDRSIADSIPTPEYYLLEKERRGFWDRTWKKSENKQKIHIVQKESMNDQAYVSPILASPTIELIKKTLTEKKSIFIFSARKSIATATSCRDCGFIVSCPNCHAIMHLIKKNPLSEMDRVFVCNRCETEIPPMNRCPVCLGWNLIPLGITTEAIIEELKKFFPSEIVYHSNNEITKTDASCKKLVNAWEQSGGILVGTQKIIPHINSVSNIVIASYEQCMSIPDFKTPFNTLWLFQKLYEKTTEHYIVQAKDKDEDFLNKFKAQDMSTLLQDDTTLRKQFQYPPFATLITVTLKNITRKDHMRAKDFLQKPLIPYDHSVQSQFFEHTQNYSITAKIHIPKNKAGDIVPPEYHTLMGFLGSIRDYADITIENAW
jgi:primosomal protein N'